MLNGLLPCIQVFICALVLMAGPLQAAASATSVIVSPYAVRFVAPGPHQLLRVQVLSLDGEQVFDTGTTAAPHLEWNRLDPQGRPAVPGVYLAALTLRDQAGRVSQQIQELALEGQANQQGEALPPVTDVTGGGTTGRIAKWTGADVLGNASITDSVGRIGIGTLTPTSVLQVNGGQPPALAGNGTTAIAALSVQGGKGGNTTLSGAFTGGTGGGILLFSGAGGDAVGGSGNGNGGNILLQTGAPGNGGVAGSRGRLMLNPFGGNVGIGTVNPFTALQVVSDNVFVPAIRGSSNTGFGVQGISTDDVGVHGRSSNGTGVWGETLNPDAFAGFFIGKVHVTGTLTKGAGAFQIDHPLDPANKLLSHSFVESPDMKNIYDGVAALDDSGEATVELPAWFETLNSDFRYQLTCIGGHAPVYVAQKVQGNRFRIAGGRPGLEVSWQVTGIRQDAFAQAHRIKIEEDKPEKERGYYLHPKELGQPEEKGVASVRAASPR